MKLFASSIVCVWILSVMMPDASGLVVSSMTSIRQLIERSRSLPTNLQKFIEHEEFRLKVMHNVSRYEKEEPLVRQRIEEFKILHQDLIKNQTSSKELIDSVHKGHPTSIYALVRNFVAGWDKMLTNKTLYGKRLREFLKIDKEFHLPGQKDLEMAGTAINIIMMTYNVSLDDVIKGSFFGHQGQPLNLADCYDIAKSCMASNLVETAKAWLEAAFHGLDLDHVTKQSAPFNVTDGLIRLSRIIFQDGDSVRALQLMEKATELDPDDFRLHQLFLQYRFGRDVKPLPSLNKAKMEKWRSTFFHMCGNVTRSPLTLNTSLNFSRRQCRYRYSGIVPYRRYQEEILSFSPFISVIYDLVSTREITLVRNATKGKLHEFVLPGNDKATLWQQKSRIMHDKEKVIADISSRIGDVTGHNVSQAQDALLGEPAHVIDFGIGGTCLPHSDNLKSYLHSYMGIKPGNRLATIQVFMGDTKAGGEVVFFDPVVSVRPRKGMALLYYNYRPDGRRDERAYAGTCPLAVGENLVLEKGIWSTGLDDNVLCGKSPKTTFYGLEKSRARNRRKPEQTESEETSAEPEKTDSPEDSKDSN